MVSHSAIKGWSLRTNFVMLAFRCIDPYPHLLILILILILLCLSLSLSCRSQVDNWEEMLEGWPCRRIEGECRSCPLSLRQFLCQDFYEKIFAIQVLNSFKDNILQDFISLHQPDLLLLVMRKLIFVSDNISQNFCSSDSAAAKAMLPKAGHWGAQKSSFNEGCFCEL